MNSPQRQIEVEQRDDITVITITDSKVNEYEQSHELRDNIEDAIRRAEVPKVVLDMRNVEYITSVALLPFVSMSKTAEELGGHVVLCNLADVVAKVLTVSQLLVEHRTSAKHLQMANTLESAIEIVRAES